MSYIFPTLTKPSRKVQNAPETRQDKHKGQYTLVYSNIKLLLKKRERETEREILN
jgi:hypothetical protein